MASVVFNHKAPPQGSAAIGFQNTRHLRWTSRTWLRTYAGTNVGNTFQISFHCVAGGSEGFQTKLRSF